MVYKQYELWKGNAKFFWKGFLMTGPNPYAPLITFLIIIVPFVLADCTTVYFVACKSSLAVLVIVVLLQLITLYWMIAAAIMDPGYIPRRNFIRTVRWEQSELSLEDQAVPFFDQYIFDKGRTVKLKYCITWEIFRPPRSSHCGTCDACIEWIDHHWPWLGTCIGKRNYKYFFIFINLLSLIQVIAVALSVLEIYLRVSEKLNEDGKQGFTLLFILNSYLHNSTIWHDIFDQAW